MERSLQCGTSVAAPVSIAVILYAQTKADGVPSSAVIGQLKAIPRVSSVKIFRRQTEFVRASSFH